MDAPGLDDRPSAVALSAASAGRAPMLLAKGYGVAAEAIVERAREHGLYVHAAPELVKLLMQLDLDTQIPPQLYRAVAEMLAWLHQLDNEAAST